MTTADAIIEAGGRGLTLAPVGGNLTVQPASRCPPEFAATLREHKLGLLTLLQLDFLVVKSAILRETIFFAADDETKAALVNAGAESGCIYTRKELRLLIEQNRRGPLTADDLLRIHAAKRMFNGRIESYLP